VFGEHAVYDPDTGQLLSGSFMDYPMPRAGLVEGLANPRAPGADRRQPARAQKAWAKPASAARSPRL